MLLKPPEQPRAVGHRASLTDRGPFNTNTPWPAELEVDSSLEPDASDFQVGQVQGSRKASLPAWTVLCLIPEI